MKLYTFKIPFVVLLVFAFTTSCKQSLFLQRKYTKGIYVERVSKTPVIKKGEAKTIAIVKPEIRSAYKQIAGSAGPNSAATELIASKATRILSGKIPFKALPKTIGEECGDKIILKNGKTITCKVYEISETLIKYKLCDQLAGRYYFAEVADAYKILFVNGTEEVFKYKNESAYAPPTVIDSEQGGGPKKGLVGLAKFGFFVSAVISFIIAVAGVPAAIIFALIFLALGLILSYYYVNKEHSVVTSLLTVLGSLLGIVLLASLFLLIIALLALTAL